MRAARPPIDGAWLEDELAELERLAESGDTLELVARLGAHIEALPPERRAAGVRLLEALEEILRP
jgi:hypothetical protein